MFAGSCIGVVLLVMTLELLRRFTKEYDRYLVRRHVAATSPDGGSGEEREEAGPHKASNATDKSSPSTPGVRSPRRSPRAATPFRASAAQQAVRALLHTLQFAVAYLIMLLAMYYNGYIILSIFCGAYLGAFLFQWEVLGGRSGLAAGTPGACNEATVCCG